MSNTAPKTSVNCEPLKKLIREVPDFPIKGILFYDITTLLKDKLGFAPLSKRLADTYFTKVFALVLGRKARELILVRPSAYGLMAAFFPGPSPANLPPKQPRLD